MRRRHLHAWPRGLTLALVTFSLLIAPASAFDFEADEGTTAADCCCSPEEAPPPSCCEETQIDLTRLFVSDEDCGCAAPSPPAPGAPAPVPQGASSQASAALQHRLRIGAETPAAFAAGVSTVVRGCEPPPGVDLREDQSVLHRRALRGTSVLLAVLSVAQI
jgi:hypothetical protein